MENHVVLFGETNYRNKNTKFGIKTDDRRRHMYVIGKTGMGKTTLLENMVAQDIQAGRGVAIVDPHGEFAEKALDWVPKSRVNDVIYFNPGDVEWPIAFNVMEQVDPVYRSIMADGLVEVFKKLWADTWGPRLEYVLRNAILALLEYPDATLLGIMRILVDKEYRKEVVDHLTDAVVKSFWVNEFARYHQQFAVEAIAPIQNKVGQFLTSSLIRNIVGQTKTAIDLRDAMDSGKILIMNLSKGRIGEGSSRLLGAMMITKLQLAAMSRVDIPEEQRSDFYLYVDEFQNFATISFVNILSEARKYRLNLVLAHQYVEQLEEEVRAAVFGNVGTIVLFRVGAVDAVILEKEFLPEFTETDLVNLNKFNTYLKLMIDGTASKAFSATTLPPPQKLHESHRETIINISRERFSTPRNVVEDKISRWFEGFAEGEQKAGDARQGQGKERLDARPTWDATCWSCGKKTSVPFEPDGVRPIYCETCLADIRAGKMKPIAPRQNQTQPHAPNPTTAANVRQAPEPISLADAFTKFPPKRHDAMSSRSEPATRPHPPGGRANERPQSEGTAWNHHKKQERKNPDIAGIRSIIAGALDDAKHERDALPSEEEDGETA